jgi:hypothetical protein
MADVLSHRHVRARVDDGDVGHGVVPVGVRRQAGAAHRLRECRQQREGRFEVILIGEHHHVQRHLLTS